MSGESNIKILYIEDNPANYRLVDRLLSQAGFEMYWAEEGTAGFDLAAQIKPDLILMDINIPGLSGFELTSKFRNQPEFTSTPIIALTAKTQKSDRETALVAGCNGFIPKPIDPFNFVSQVKTYLGGRQEWLDKGSEGRALRQFNVHLLEHLEQRLQEAQEANQKLVETQQLLETRNRSLARLLAVGQDILREYDPWQLLKKVLRSLFLEFQCDSFVVYLQHPSNSYWEGLRLADGGLEQAPVLQGDHPFIQKLLDMETRNGWIQGPSLVAAPIWTDGSQLDIWQNNGQPCLLLYSSRHGEGAVRGFWAFDRTSNRPYLPMEIEMVRLYGRLAQVCHENADMIQSMDEKSNALNASFENLERAYRDLQRVKTELQEKDRQAVFQNLLVKIVDYMKEPIAALNQNSQFILQSLKTDDGPTAQALRDLGQTANKAEALFQALLRRTQPEASNLPEWIDLENLLRSEIAYMEAEGLLQPNQTQMDIDLADARVYGVYSDFVFLLRTMVINSAPTPETSSLPRHILARREASIIHMEIRDQAGPIHQQAFEHAFEPFQGQVASSPNTRAPNSALPQCRQILATYNGSIDLENTGEGVTLRITIALGA